MEAPALHDGPGGLGGVGRVVDRWAGHESGRLGRWRLLGMAAGFVGRALTGSGHFVFHCWFRVRNGWGPCPNYYSIPYSIWLDHGDDMGVEEMGRRPSENRQQQRYFEFGAYGRRGS